MGRYGEEDRDVRPGARRNCMASSAAGAVEDGVVWEGREVRPGMRRKVVGAAEDLVVGVGRDVRPGTRRNWLVRQEEQVLQLVLVLLPIVTMNAARGDTRGDRKMKEEKRVVDSESRHLSYLYSSTPSSLSHHCGE